MLQPVQTAFGAVTDRIRTRFGERAVSLVLALLIEAILALVLLLTLAPPIAEHIEHPMAVFDVNPAPKPEPQPEPDQPPSPKRSERTPTQQTRSPQPKVAPAPQQPSQPAPPRPQPPTPTPPTPPAFIQMSPEEMASSNLSNAPKTPKAATAAPRSVYGPVANAQDYVTAHDSERVSGSGPHGEPLYAASWYREPYPGELRGFLSAAKGPGWGMIACQTEPRYRVDHCVKVDEYPEGSGIAQAVLAAAFQFRVRPPRVGGEDQIGDWVRIRIDYGTDGPNAH